ncbi:MAG TPA: TonB-dependent receptor plug domain-containing protein [Opitutaceae bacterium]|nr:TonB-dependent receptor plug domain-containing protein [Opitutaceae bacterium]
MNKSLLHPRAPWLRAVILTMVAALPAVAQSVAGSGSPARKTDEDVIKLSPFEVRPDDDVGYQAANTTSGSRLNTSLKDTAAFISAFTPEFLSDIAATSVTDMLAFATNAELNAGDSEGSGFNNPRDFSSRGGEPFRIRGIPANVSTDYVATAIPQDLYNIERAEVASGANSILFGSGDAGGIVALSTKKARVNRNRYQGQIQAGSWESWRYSADLNQVILPRRLAIRVNGLYEDADTWRTFEYNKQKRYTVGLTFKPFKSTSISASFEDGLTDKSVGLRWNVTDQYSVWNATGRTVTDTLPTPTANAQAVGLAAFNANQRFTYFTQDGFVSNLRQELQTTIAPKPASTLLPLSVFPITVNWAGPEVYLKRDFNNGQVVLDQNIGERFAFQAGYYRNFTDARARTFFYNSNNMDLYGDPNRNIPASSGSGTMVNPRAGQLYLESNQRGDFTTTENEVYRFTGVYELDAKWLGNHRIAGLYERAVTDEETRATREILVKPGNLPVQNVNAPENVQNSVWRRNYLTEGDYSTYALHGLYKPITPFTYLGNTLSSREVVTGELISQKKISSYVVAAQSTWMNRPGATWLRRLTSTLGYREDQIEYYDTPSGRVAAGDPRIASGERLLNEVAAIRQFDRNDIKATTLTAGAVLAVHKRLSILYNRSNNIGAPRFNRRILPDGRIPPTPEGKNWEAGVMIDLFGDDRYFARINYFDTSQIGDAAVSPSGAVTNASALGRSQTLEILAEFVRLGRMTQAEADKQGFNWNAAIIDTATHGYEIEFVGNPTRNWTFRANYSHSLRDRENFFEEGRIFFTAKFEEWRKLASGDPALQAFVEERIATIQNNEIDGRAAAQEQGFGNIPHKFNVVSRYGFTEGTLKGAFVGGAVRYQSKVFSQTDTNTGRDFFANESIYADAFAGYKFRVAWLPKAQLTLQLNIRNLTNSYLVTTARWNADFSGPRRLYVRDPRSFRLTGTLEF